MFLGRFWNTVKGVNLRIPFTVSLAAIFIAVFPLDSQSSTLDNYEIDKCGGDFPFQDLESFGPKKFHKRFFCVNKKDSGARYIVPKIVPLADATAIKQLLEPSKFLDKGYDYKKEAKEFADAKKGEIRHLLLDFVVLDRSGFFSDKDLWFELGWTTEGKEISSASTDKRKAKKELKKAATLLKSYGALLESLGADNFEFENTEQRTVLRKTDIWSNFESAESALDEGNKDKFEQEFNNVRDVLKRLSPSGKEAYIKINRSDAWLKNVFGLGFDKIEKNKISLKSFKDKLNNFKNLSEKYIENKAGWEEFHTKVKKSRVKIDFSRMFDSLGKGLEAFFLFTKYYALLSAEYEKNLQVKRNALEFLKENLDDSYEEAIEPLLSEVSRMQKEPESFVDKYLYNSGWMDGDMGLAKKADKVLKSGEDVYTAANLVGFANPVLNKVFFVGGTLSDLYNGFSQYQDVQEFSIGAMTLAYDLERAMGKFDYNDTDNRLRAKLIQSGLGVFAYQNIMRLYDPAGNTESSYEDLVNSKTIAGLWMEHIVMPAVKGASFAGPIGASTRLVAKNSGALTRTKFSWCGAIKGTDGAVFRSEQDRMLCSGPSAYNSFGNPVIAWGKNLRNSATSEGISEDEILISHVGTNGKSNPETFVFREDEKVRLRVDWKKFDQIELKFPDSEVGNVDTQYMVDKKGERVATLVTITGLNPGKVHPFKLIGYPKDLPEKVTAKRFLHIVPEEYAPRIEKINVSGGPFVGLGQPVNLSLRFKQDPPQDKIRAIRWTLLDDSKGHWLTRTDQRQARVLTPLSSDGSVDIRVQVRYSNGIQVSDVTTLLAEQDQNALLPGDTPSSLNGSLQPDGRISLDWTDQKKGIDYIVQSRWGEDGSFERVARLYDWQTEDNSGFQEALPAVVLREGFPSFRSAWDFFWNGKAKEWGLASEIAYRVAPASGKKVGTFTEPIVIEFPDRSSLMAGLKGPDSVTVHPGEAQADLSLAEERPASGDQVEWSRIQLTISLAEGFLKRDGEALPWPDNGLTVRGRLLDAAQQPAIPQTDWVKQTGIQPGDRVTVEGPVMRPSALVQKSGKLGDYRLELQVGYPGMMEPVTGARTYRMAYEDIQDSDFGESGAPYLEVQTAAPKDAEFDSANQSFIARGGQTLRIRPRRQDAFLSRLEGRTPQALVQRQEDGGNAKRFYLEVREEAEGTFTVQLPDDKPEGRYRIVNFGAIGPDVPDEDWIQAPTHFVQLSGTPDLTSDDGPDTPTTSAPHPLNDTGIDWCADGSSNNLDCPVAGFPGQDGEHGRDATHSDDSDGHAGFSFTKIDASGNEVSADATEWSCVKDNVTGLMWEVKADDYGLRYMGHTYTWYNPDPDTNGGDAGEEDGGSCSGGIDCDTESYVQAVNSAGLCGHSDWRMPSRTELRSIVDNSADYSTIRPFINTDYFPNSASSYWSASPDAYDSSLAWGVSFDYGNFTSYGKPIEEGVRLVRGGQ